MADTRDQFVHPVEVAEQGRLAATRGTDERRYLSRGDLEGNAVKDAFLTVIEFEIVHLDEVGLTRNEIVGEFKRAR